MSLSLYARITTMCLTEDLLDKIIIDFYAPDKNMVRQFDEECVCYEKINAKNSPIITFVKSIEPPYNIYDSSIINAEYKYMQLLIFDISKYFCSVNDYKEVLKFCIYLEEKLRCKILVTSDSHDEICILEPQQVIWAQDKEALFS